VTERVDDFYTNRPACQPDLLGITTNVTRNRVALNYQYKIRQAELHAGQPRHRTPSPNTKKLLDATRTINKAKITLTPTRRATQTVPTNKKYYALGRVTHFAGFDDQTVSVYPKQMQKQKILKTPEHQMPPAKRGGFQTKRTPKQQLVKNKRSLVSETPTVNPNQRDNTGVNQGLTPGKKSPSRF